MDQGQDEFKNRLARINAKARSVDPDGGPSIAPDLVADLRSVRRNARPAGIGGVLAGVWAIPTFRYGLPIVLGVIGFSVASAFVPDVLHRIVVAQAREDGATGEVITPFNASSIALKRQAAFLQSMELLDAAEAEHSR